jgi:hypothetical protein
MGKSIGKRGGDIIRNVLNRRNNLSVKLASAISAKYHVSYKWLMTTGLSQFVSNSMDTN